MLYTYARLNDLKAYLGITASDDDGLLTRLLSAATAQIDKYTCRRFELVDETRAFGENHLLNDSLLMLDDDLQLFDVAINGDNIAIPRNLMSLVPLTPPHWAIQLRHGRFIPPVRVSGLWGYSLSPPPDIAQACIRLAAYMYRQRDAQVFDVTAFPEQGALTIPRGMPADVKVVLDQYRRKG